MLALVFACIGSAYGTGKAGMGISHVGVSKPEVSTAAHPLSGGRETARPAWGPMRGGRTPSRAEAPRWLLPPLPLLHWLQPLALPPPYSLCDLRVPGPSLDRTHFPDCMRMLANPSHGTPLGRSS